MTIVKELYTSRVVRTISRFHSQRASAQNWEKNIFITIVVLKAHLSSKIHVHVKQISSSFQATSSILVAMNFKENQIQEITWNSSGTVVLCYSYIIRWKRCFIPHGKHWSWRINKRNSVRQLCVHTHKAKSRCVTYICGATEKHFI